MNNTASATLTIRVIASGGKFLGDDISGATVTVHNALTGELLAQGSITGGSGDTWDLMVNPHPRTSPLPVQQASAFTATITGEANKPIQLLVAATGPGAGLQSKATTSTTQWIIPGLCDNAGNAVAYSCLLELPGLLVQVMQPPTHLNVTSKLPLTIPFEVNVAMMCGCPIDDGTVTEPATATSPEHVFPNPWPVNDFEAGCIITCEHQPPYQLPLKFDSQNAPGRYTGTWQMTAPGFYTAHVYARQLSTGNFGTATVSVFQIPATA